MILVCFDVTNCGSLDNVPDWIELALKEKCGQTKDSLIVLVGNKVDDKTNRQVGSIQNFTTICIRGGIKHEISRRKAMD